MATTTNEARLRLTAQDDTGAGMSSAARNMRRTADEAERSAKRIVAAQERAAAGRAAAMSGAATAIAGGLSGAAAIAFAKDSYTAFAASDRYLTRIGNNAGKTSREMAGVGKTISKIANDYALPLSTVAEGLDNLVASGRSLEDSMAFLPSVAAAAQASGASITDISASAGALGTAMGITAGQMTKAFDILVAGGQAGNFELKDMARYLPSLAPMVAAVGYKGEDGLRKLVAILQVVRKQTGTAEEAATSVGEVFSKMNSTEMVAAFKELGNFDLKGTMEAAQKAGKDLPSTFIGFTRDVLTAAAKGGDPLLKLPLLFKDKQLQQGMRALLSQPGAVKELVAQLQNVDGTTTKNLANITEDAASQAQRLATSWEEVKRAVGSVLGASGVPEGLKAIADDLNRSAEGMARIAKYGLGGAISRAFNKDALESATQERDDKAKEVEGASSPGEKARLEGELRELEQRVALAKGRFDRADQAVSQKNEGLPPLPDLPGPLDPSLTPGRNEVPRTVEPGFTPPRMPSIRDERDEVPRNPFGGNGPAFRGPERGAAFSPTSYGTDTSDIRSMIQKASFGREDDPRPLPRQVPRDGRDDASDFRELVQRASLGGEGAQEGTQRDMARDVSKLVSIWSRAVGANAPGGRFGMGLAKPGGEGGASGLPFGLGEGPGRDGIGPGGSGGGGGAFGGDAGRSSGGAYGSGSLRYGTQRGGSRGAGIAGPGASAGPGGVRGGHAGPTSAQGKANVASWLAYAQKPVADGGLGLSAEQAHGMVAGMQGESGKNLDASAYNPNDRGMPSGGSMQWRAERLQALKAFAAARGDTANNGMGGVETQQQYQRHEFLGKGGATGGSEARAFAALKGESTREGALKQFVAKGERPQFPGPEIQKRSQYLYGHGGEDDKQSPSGETAESSDKRGRGSANYMHGQHGGIGENLTRIRTPSGKTASVNAAAAPHFQAFVNELEAQGYKVNSLGGFNDRNKRGGTSKSQHAYGNAIDINPERNPFMRPNADGSFQTDMPKNISDLADKHGLTWGGDWKSVKDAMHFEWTGRTPEEKAKVAEDKAKAKAAGITDEHAGHNHGPGEHGKEDPAKPSPFGLTPEKRAELAKLRASREAAGMAEVSGPMRPEDITKNSPFADAKDKPKRWVQDRETQKWKPDFENDGSGPEAPNPRRPIDARKAPPALEDGGSGFKPQAAPSLPPAQQERLRERSTSQARREMDRETRNARMNTYSDVGVA